MADPHIRMAHTAYAPGRDEGCRARMEGPDGIDAARAGAEDYSESVLAGVSVVASASVSPAGGSGSTEIRTVIVPPLLV